MKTLTQSNPIQITASVPRFVKLNTYLVRPLKAGFAGFAVAQPSWTAGAEMATASFT